MENNTLINPAEAAAKEAIKQVFFCINTNKSFVFEAGAGAGKTYSLVQALQYIIEKRGREYLHKSQRVACITYTNVASKEIQSRINNHPAVFSATIHSFCWEVIKDFQAELRKALMKFDKWIERIKEAEIEDLGVRKVLYDLGYPKIEEDRVWLGHNDIIRLMVELMKFPKFRNILTYRFPVLFIDEYQDTDVLIAESFKTNFLDNNEGPLIGFFGDHWQKIYGTGCGKIEHKNLETIDKKANFRSVRNIVECLNRIRKELPQEVSDPIALGEVKICLTNNWTGARRTGGHWAGDLPSPEAHKCLEYLKTSLTSSGWDFAGGESKILMLTHNVLAEEQGYKNLIDVFSYTDQLIKKENPYISFLVDILEPVCAAYKNRKFGEMFAVLDRRTPTIHSHKTKIEWVKDMNTLMELRLNGSIGDIITHLMKVKKPRLPEMIEEMEKEYSFWIEHPDETENADLFDMISRLKQVRYEEIIAFTNYSNEVSPFSTKHGVKGVEFENVLVVIGRGWNLYNFNQMLEFAQNCPPDKQDTFERNRNLFYVACSRPKKRLTILFTQVLSPKAVGTLNEWFGTNNITNLNFN